MPAQNLSTALSTLTGAMLEAVTFVMDYVQLQFDGARLTAFTLPQVELPGRRWTSEDTGWRDSLCARIGIVVKNASHSEERLQFEFQDGAAITISLRDEDYRGPEAFTLSAPGHGLIVA